MPRRLLIDVELDDSDPQVVDKVTRLVAGEIRTLVYDMGGDVEPSVHVTSVPPASASMAVPVDPNRDAVLEGLARTTLDVDTLQVRSSDSLDFYDCHVGRIAEALQTAWELGRSGAATRDACPSATTADDGRPVRCGEPSGHGGRHRAGGLEWDS